MEPVQLDRHNSYTKIVATVVVLIIIIVGYVGWKHYRSASNAVQFTVISTSTQSSIDAFTKTDQNLVYVADPVYARGTQYAPQQDTSSSTGAVDISFRTHSSFDQVIQLYRNNLHLNGFEVLREVPAYEMDRIFATKGSSTLLVTIQNEATSTLVTLSLTN